MILVDSTVFIDLLRARRDPRVVLAPHVRAGWIGTCDVIRLEVVRGIVLPDCRADLEEFFDLMPRLELDGDVWRRARELGWTLDRAGQVLPATDLVIAACALVHRAALVSTDRHFGFVPGLKVWKTLPTPAGLE